MTHTVPDDTAVQLYTLHAERHARRATLLLHAAISTPAPTHRLRALRQAAGHQAASAGAILAAIANLPADADTEGS